MRTRPLQTFYAFVTLAVLCLATSGCSLFGTELDRAAKGAGDLVTFYCTNIPSPEIREQFRAAVNAHAAPHSVMVTCASGGAPLISTPAPADNPGAHLMPTQNPHEQERLRQREEDVARTAAPITDAALALAREHRERIDTLERELAAWKNNYGALYVAHNTLTQTHNATLADLAAAIDARDGEMLAHSTTRTELVAARAELARLSSDAINVNEALAGSVPGASLLT